MRDTNPDPCRAYIRTLHAQEDKALQFARTTAERTGFPIHISPERGALLRLLVTIIQPKTILEIGCFTGYSALWMAQALPNKSRLITLEHTPEHAAIARQSFAKADYAQTIELVEQDASAWLVTSGTSETFDFIFIDADKRSYLDYLDHAERRLNPKGLLVADNTLLSGAVYQEAPPERIRTSTRDIMRQFNTRIANHPHFQSLLLPIDDGLTIASKSCRL